MRRKRVKIHLGHGFKRKVHLTFYFQNLKCGPGQKYVGDQRQGFKIARLHSNVKASKLSFNTQNLPCLRLLKAIMNGRSFVLACVIPIQVFISS